MTQLEVRLSGRHEILDLNHWGCVLFLAEKIPGLSGRLVFYSFIIFPTYNGGGKS